VSGVVAQMVTKSNRDLFQMLWVQFLPLQNCHGWEKHKNFKVEEFLKMSGKFLDIVKVSEK